jgi:hypothetical protein
VRSERLCQVRVKLASVVVGHDTDLTASRRERVINAGRPTVDNNQVGTVPREQTIDNLLREVITTPVPVARD